MPEAGVHHRVACQVYVVSPYYDPQLLQLYWTVPCEARDAERYVSRHLRHTHFPHASMFVACQPQPSREFATFLAIPEWTTFAGLSGVVLDLRAATIGQEGPIIGSFLSRPTTAAEIRREAGLYSMGRCHIMVGTSNDPLRDDEQVYLDNGSLVRLIRVEYEVADLPSLDHILSSETMDCFQGPLPAMPTSRVLQLLHSAGRYFFSGQRAAGQPLHTAIVEFVGVPAGSVTFHSPGEGCCERLCFRGMRVRDTLVLADRSPDGAAPLVVFLDLRPVGGVIQFFSLQHPRIDYADLEAILPRPAPAGWQLTVEGGRRCRGYLEIWHRCTLLFCFAGVLEPLGEEAPPSDPSEQSDGPGPEEDGEEEDQTDDHSQSSTRSRSRPRHARTDAPGSPSSDPSFQGSFQPAAGHGPAASPLLLSLPMGSFLGQVRLLPAPGHAERLQALGRAMHQSKLPLSSWVRRGVFRESLEFQGASALTLLDVVPSAPWLGPVDLRAHLLLPPLEELSLLYSTVATLQTGCSAPGDRVPKLFSYAGSVACRLPDLPAIGGDSTAAPSGPAWMATSPFIGERNPPQHHLPAFERPAPAAGEVLNGEPFRATALIFVPEYPPEVVTITVEPGFDITQAVARFQLARQDLPMERFDRLLAASPQPVTQYASLVAFADWHGGLVALFDCLRYNGTQYAALVSPAMTRDALLAVAGIRPEQEVEVYVADYPLPLGSDDVIEMHAGYTVSFVSQGHPPFAVAYLADMLLSPAGWAAEVDLPVQEQRWFYVVSDDAPLFHPVMSERRHLLRADLADRLHYDLAALQIIPTVPRMRDFSDYGAPVQHVLIATQFPLTDPVTRAPRGVLLLDLRPLHAGLTWEFCTGFSIRAQTLVDRFSRPCPASHYVSISGARPRHEDDGLYFDFEQGQVLTVDYRVLPDSSVTGSDESNDDDRDSSAPDDPSMLDRDSLDPGSDDGSDVAATSMGEEPPFARSLDGPLLLSFWEPGVHKGRTVAPVMELLALRLTAAGQEASQCSACPAFAVAAVTLEVLFSAFPPGSLVLPPKQISLETSIPVSAFQQLALELQTLVPVPGDVEDPAALVDWLDGDLRAVQQDGQVPAAKRTLFRGIPKWHDCSNGLVPSRIIVYTDGSTTPVQTSADILPGAWAVSVWVEALPGPQEYLLGCAADVLVPPDHPHFVGAALDIPLTCEQAAIAWGLCWVIQFGQPLPTWVAGLGGWLSHLSPADLPTLFAFESEAARMQAVRTRGDARPTMGARAGTRETTTVLLCLHVATFNVLSLLDPASANAATTAACGQGMRVVAKRELLKRQFQSADLLLAGLQETRLRDEATLPDGDFIMLCAPADERGHFGVSLWASKHVPYASQGAQKLRLQPRHFTVTACEPRMLVVQVCAPYLSLTIVVAHAPSEPPAAAGSAERFWKRCSRFVQRRPRHSEILVLCDANARVGEHTSDAIGGLDPETENPSGQAWHSFLAREQLWVPATFTACHAGPSCTWWAPGGQGHRLDYVAVPASWPTGSIRSKVWQDFEVMQLRDDHAPATLSASFSRGPKGEGNLQFTRQAIRPHPHSASPGYAADLVSLTRLPAAAWGADVDTHFANVAKAWGTLGAALCPPAPARACQTYLSVGTLQLVAWRRDWRRHLRAVRDRCADRRRALCFVVWQLSCSRVHLLPSQSDGLLQWSRQYLPWLGRAAMMVFRTSKLLRRASKSDRVVYLDGLVRAVSLADLKDPKQLFRRVRAAFPQARASRRPSFVPLPAVLDADGQLATSPEARLECWRRHFAAQEAGELRAPDDYPGLLRDQKAQAPVCAPVFDLACVPTLTAVEQTLAGLPYGKASGYDGMTGELLRLDVPASARVLVPMFAKASMGLYEPVEWRGGALVPLAKRAAAALSCDRFRSILVSSIPGKVYHRQLRTLLMPALESVRGDTQAGAVPGISTESIAMVARGFRDVMVARQRAWALVFFDVRAAYYRVIRQLLAQVGDTETALRRLFHEMGVPPSALGELRDGLERLGALSSAGASDHLCAVLSDAMEGTWFRLDFGSTLTVTHRGVRPGDCLADVLFGFTLSAYLTATERALESAGLSEPMPTSAGPSLWPDAVAPPRLECGSWADDFVRMTSQLCRRTLSMRVTKVVSVFVAQAEALGIELTFAADKTAAVMSDVEEQSPPVLSDQDGRFLVVTSSASGVEHRLPIVDAYKHLGGIATVSGTPVPEIGLRHSLALNVVRPLRARLFSEVGIPFDTRRHLLKSLAMSRYTFGSAALSLLSGIHKRLWAKHYVALWRSLWRRRKGESFRHCYAVLGPARAPPPPLALALARAVLLRQITSRGPSTLLHLLTVHWHESPRKAWLSQVHGDIVHVAQYGRAAETLLGTRVPVASLLEAIYDDPGWWVRQVKAACRQAQEDLDAWNSHVCHVSERASPGELGPAGTPEVPYTCLWCGAAFRLRKHLCVHLARTHRVFSPARHLAHGSTCVSCLKCFRTVARHQQHLRTTSSCMLRTCLLVPCLTVEEMHLEEGSVTKQARGLRAGVWTSYQAALPSIQAHGPHALPASERLDLLGEDADLGLMSRLFYPDPHFLSWVELFLDSRSTEGPRSGTSSFWDRRPARQPLSFT
ncbi:unnamed protein product [Symbiodinium sp. CCMP2592]|nr:unnamed protein product [Symbiodinium sp. CCMP2592]